ncbi:MAG: hypothetical protein K0S04_581 [Herbinix sp.]|nr:hypothetical protein [Herbinix sp.]
MIALLAKRKQIKIIASAFAVGYHFLFLSLTVKYLHNSGEGSINITGIKEPMTKIMID